MDVALVMFKVDGSRHDFPIEKDRILIGRTISCDLRIPLSSVSRQHCELRREEGAVKLRDLGSSNGTFLNHHRVQEATLCAGDQVVIGPVVFTVVIDGEPAEVQPVKSIVSRQGRAASDSEESSAPSAERIEEIPEEQAVPEEVEEESHTPTVELDEDYEDDPVAALESMIREQDQEKDESRSSRGG